ncbi:hypothetical protein CEB3_c37740 [Peptococcaceae bacterium CEB3]|nr:hypothetical protein CEB3_c37740 [Peptococcaceae bacterium CEB3]
MLDIGNFSYYYEVSINIKMYRHISKLTEVLNPERGEAEIHFYRFGVNPKIPHWLGALFTTGFRTRLEREFVRNIIGAVSGSIGLPESLPWM